MCIRDSVRATHLRVRADVSARQRVRACMRALVSRQGAVAFQRFAGASNGARTLLVLQCAAESQQSEGEMLFVTLVGW